MRTRTIALLVLVPLGALVAFGLVRMIKTDWAVEAMPAKEEPTRSDRASRPEENPDGQAGSAVADQMRRIYRANRRGSPSVAAVEQFGKLAATLELRQLLGLLDELEAPTESHTATEPFLLHLYARWAELEPVKAWEKVRQAANDAEKDADRERLVSRMVEMLVTWSRADADAALAAFMEVESAVEGISNSVLWWPGLNELFENAAKTLGAKLPERLRGIINPDTHAIALGHWARVLFQANTDPVQLARVLGEEAVLAAGGQNADAQRLAAFRDAADEPLVRVWFEKDPVPALSWYAQFRGAEAAFAYLERGYNPPDGWIQPALMRQFLMALPVELRDQWIPVWLFKTSGADLGLLGGLSSAELRWKFLRQAAWPKVEQKEEGFIPWACDPAAVREAMKSMQLDESQRAEIEAILSVR